MSHSIKLIFLFIYAYPFGFIAGSILIRALLVFVDPSASEKLGGKGIQLRNTGFWIGVCEHFLVVSFILVGQYTALGILLAARGVVRSENIREKPSYYLLGMLLSFCSAVFFGLSAKLLFINLGIKIPRL